jgi:uncharacterized protein
VTVITDTSAVLALVDAGDRHHPAVRELWERDPAGWVVPWAVLPEIDYLLRRHVGHETARLFMRDVCDGAFAVEYGDAWDMKRATELDEQYADLGIGLVDGVVAAIAERLRAAAIATLDVRHFGALRLSGAPVLLPRDG